MILWVRRLTISVVVFLAAIQIFQPAKTNPRTDPGMEIYRSAPMEVAVASVLGQSCNDCHSNHTIWPWYSRVAPISWLVISDVNRGRRALNFSEWNSYAPDTQRRYLTEICKEASDGEMPVFSYRLMHSQANLTKNKIIVVCRWAQSTNQTSASSTISSNACRREVLWAEQQTIRRKR